MTPIVCISRSKPSEKRGHFVRLIEVGMHIVMNDGALQQSMSISHLVRGQQASVDLWMYAGGW